jgi:hypothetical protein
MDLASELNEIKALLKQLMVIVKDEPATLTEEECERISQEKFRAMEEFNKPENIALRNNKSQITKMTTQGESLASLDVSADVSD